MSDREKPRVDDASGGICVSQLGLKIKARSLKRPGPREERVRALKCSVKLVGRASDRACSEMAGHPCFFFFLG